MKAGIGDLAMEDCAENLQIGFSGIFFFLSQAHLVLNQRETVGKQRIAMTVLDAIIRIQQSLDIFYKRLGVIHKGLKKQEYLNHIAHLFASDGPDGIDRASHKDAQRTGNEKLIPDRWGRFVTQGLLIEAEQIGREIHVQQFLIVP